MKRWIVLLGIAWLSAASTGCMVMPPWSPDPTIRAQQLIVYSEQLRLSGQDMSQLLLLNQPTALNPVRLDGAIGP